MDISRPQMNISLARIWFTPRSTCGLLAIDGVSKFCTLEPSVGSGMLMPVGTYHCKMTLSPRLQYTCPEIWDVPGHTGERIHVGNRPEDTHGCILVGENHSPDWVGLSEAAFHVLMSMLPDEFDLTITEQSHDDVT